MMPKIGVKYCGNCNPQIDSPEIVRKLEKILDSNLLPFFYDDYPQLDLLIILCGCPKKCVDIPEVSRKAKYCLVVGGETVNGVAVKAGDLTAFLKEKINRLMNC